MASTGWTRWESPGVSTTQADAPELLFFFFFFLMEKCLSANPPTEIDGRQQWRPGPRPGLFPARPGRAPGPPPSPMLLKLALPACAWAIFSAKNSELGGRFIKPSVISPSK